MEIRDTRMARGSRKQEYTMHPARSIFVVRNRDGDLAVSRLLNNNSIPIETVMSTETLGVLDYASTRYWNFFALVEYLFCQIATMNNCICCVCFVLRYIYIYVPFLSNV